MGIDIALVTKSNNVKQEVFDPNGYLFSMAIEHWGGEKDSHCLQFIDAFGSTLFNRLQVPHLLQEIRRFSEAVTDSRWKAHLGKVCRLVEQAEHKGYMIEFTGD